jgi:hypothetical protein
VAGGGGHGGAMVSSRRVSARDLDRERGGVREIWEEGAAGSGKRREGRERIRARVSLSRSCLE